MMSSKTRALIGWFVAVVMFSASPIVGGAPDVIELSCKKPLRLSNMYVNRSQVPRYGKLEITFDLEGHWDNPFDSKQVQVDAGVTSPDGKMLVVPGFFYQEYKRTLKNGEDSYTPVGESVWKIRFAPTQVGQYTYRVKVVNRGETAASDEGKFTCSADTASHGFVRVSKTNPLYFEYDDGTPFFAIANCQWWDKIGETEAFYAEFARAGGNMTRNFLERIGDLAADKDLVDDPPVSPRPDRGFGKIDLDRAWRQDQAFEQCEKLGLCQQLALANGMQFLPSQEKRWSMCVYNTAQGGPLSSQSAKEYFTNAAARENFKLVLRYFVARWGYSTAVFSWNLWNEVDLSPQYDKLRDEARQWHREMAQYLRQSDWAGHVIHTNFKNINGDPILDGLGEMDIVSVNTYTSMNFAPAAETWIKRHTAAYGKPVMFGEFGIGHSYGPEGYAPHDPGRIMAHNGMWSSMMSGSASTGMAFGWNWLQHEKYYTYVEALAKYVGGVPFSKRKWQPISVESFRFRDATRASYCADTFVEGWHMNYRFPPGWEKREVFEIGPDGRVKDHDFMSGFIGPPLGRKKIALKMVYPEAGEFVIFVPEIFLRSDSPGPPELTASLDGRIVLQQNFAVNPKNAREIYRHYRFSVPAGPHTITIENTGGGFFPVGYELRGFVHRDGPDLEVRGQQTDDMILLWLKSPKLTWLHARMGIEPHEQPAGKLVLAKVPEGIWGAEWLDTIENRWLERSVEESQGGKLIIEVPPIRRSVALRLFKATGTAGQKAAPSPWKVHDMDRPAPGHVTPGATGPVVLAPPSDAVVLFDGKDLSKWSGMGGEPAPWKVQDGLMEVVPENISIRSRQEFGDCQLHLEWKINRPVTGEGNKRGNSGVILMGFYEVQIMESAEYQTFPDGQNAAVFGQHPPLVNASLSPDRWQSFDIVFRRPRFDGQGKLLWPAKLTLLHNGILVHDHVEIQGRATWIGEIRYEPHADRLSLVLQGHSQPVQFRNVWIRDLEHPTPPEHALSPEKEISLEPAMLDRYIGIYETASALQIEIAREADHLKMKPFGEIERHLFAKSVNTFFAREIDIDIVFQSTPEGEITGLLFQMADQKLDARRIR